MTASVQLPSGGVLIITGQVFECMASFAQHGRRDKEAGGMLIGHHPLESEDIVLDRLTTPQPEDRRHRRRFERDQAAHQRLLDHEWQLSGGKRTYLGEWRTHPEPHPSPSHLDRRSWSGALRHTAFHGPGLVFIIVGTETVRLWFGSARGHRVHLLSIRAASPTTTRPDGVSP